MARAKDVASTARDESPRATPQDDWQLASRYSLAAYAYYVHGYWPAKHHDVWIAELERMVAEIGKSDRLLITAPPGHAKSSYISEAFPTWFLGRFPDKAILHFTAADDLAGLYHAIIEGTLKGSDDEPEDKGYRHRQVFPQPACRPGDVWNFEKGLKLKGAREKASYRMRGFGSATLGLRADVIILDDPLTEEKATSDVDLPKAKRYFDRTIKTRLKPGGKIVAIMTRWQHNDLAQHLVTKHGFRHINMPALGYWDGQGIEGGALWADYIPREELIAEREAMGDEDFGTVYQGEPTSAEGGKLKPDLVMQLPDMAARDELDRPRIKITDRAQSWDLAFTSKRSSDFTVCATVETDGYSIYLRDLYEERINEAQFEGQLNLQAQVWAPYKIGIEAIAAAKWIVAGVDRRTLLPIMAIDVATQTKEARASLLALLIGKGRFFADRKAKYWPRVAEQMRQFPKGAHDDIVDAIAQGCHLLVGNRIQHVHTTRYARESTYHQETLRDRIRRKRGGRIATPA